MSRDGVASLPYGHYSHISQQKGWGFYKSTCYECGHTILKSGNAQALSSDLEMIGTAIYQAPFTCSDNSGNPINMLEWMAIGKSRPSGSVLRGKELGLQDSVPSPLPDYCNVQAAACSLCSLRIEKGV